MKKISLHKPILLAAFVLLTSLAAFAQGSTNPIDLATVTGTTLENLSKLKAL